jgi:hypothetical protein
MQLCQLTETCNWQMVMKEKKHVVINEEEKKFQVIFW